MSDSALFPHDPQPQSLEDFTRDLNQTRQALINAGVRVATEQE